MTPTVAPRQGPPVGGTLTEEPSRGPLHWKPSVPGETPGAPRGTAQGRSLQGDTVHSDPSRGTNRPLKRDHTSGIPPLRHIQVSPPEDHSSWTPTVVPLQGHPSKNPKRGPHNRGPEGPILGDLSTSTGDHSSGIPYLGPLQRNAYMQTPPVTSLTWDTSRGTPTCRPLLGYPCR